MKRARSFASMMRYGAVATAMLAIAGCGGGGGGDGGAPTDMIDITADNEDALAHAAAMGIQDLSLASVAGELSLKAKDTALGLLRRPVDAVKRETSQALIGPTTEPCALGGTRSATHDDQNNDGQVSIGEPMTIQVASCEDTAGEVMNGTLALTITQVTDTGFMATATITNLAFSMPMAARSMTLDGGITVLYSEYADPTLFTEVVQLTVSDPLSIQVVNAPFNDRVTLLSDYVIKTTTDWRGFDATVTTTAQGDIASELAGGRVQLRTSQPMVRGPMQSHPQQGEVKLQGRRGSLTLSAQLTDRVRIEADYDGDGTVDRSRDQDWSWLL